MRIRQKNMFDWFLWVFDFWSCFRGLFHNKWQMVSNFLEVIWKKSKRKWKKRAERNRRGWWKRSEDDGWFYNGASNWRTENYPAKAKGRLSSRFSVRFKISFSLLKDDLRPVSGLPNETLVAWISSSSSFLYCWTSVHDDFGVFWVASFFLIICSRQPHIFQRRDPSYSSSSQIHLTSCAGVDVIIGW
jgi:hypothetical protein